MRITSWAKKTALLLSLLAAFLPTLSCSKTAPEGDPEKAELNDFYDLYTTYLKQHQQPPKQLADLATPEYENISPGAVAAVRSGKYVVVWGVAGKDSGTVLAYAKDAPTQGGLVLMADGTIKTMSA